jgi:hypothetical protein
VLDCWRAKQTLRPQFTIHYSPFTVHNCARRCFSGTRNLTPGSSFSARHSSRQGGSPLTALSRRLRKLGFEE